MNLGHTIAQLRAEKNISQRQLAKELSVSVGVVGMWETNKRLPSLECFISIIDYFAVSADYLLRNDRRLRQEEYISTHTELPTETQKILETFSSLNEDNKDILIGEAKKLLKNQHLEEKRSSSMAIPKAT
jgi:transcriptional regulator with XRE-family HTH domain